MKPSHFYMCAVVMALGAGSVGCAKERAPQGSGEAAEPGKEAFGTLTLDEVEAHLREAKAGTRKVAVFDNNQHERFLKSHVAGATWVDFKNIKASDLPADKDTELVFYCSNEH
jgi:hypothetical protein